MYTILTHTPTDTQRYGRRTLPDYLITNTVCLEEPSHNLVITRLSTSMYLLCSATGWMKTWSQSGMYLISWMIIKNQVDQLYKQWSWMLQPSFQQEHLLKSPKLGFFADALHEEADNLVQRLEDVDKRWEIPQEYSEPVFPQINLENNKAAGKKRRAVKRS